MWRALLLVVLVSGCRSPQPATPPAATICPPADARPSMERSHLPRMIRVHFAADDSSAECRARTAVPRVVPPDEDPVEVALRLALQGPTTSEEQAGLRSPFLRSVSEPTTPPLAPTQVRVVVKDGIATLDFTSAAGPYLLQAICARSQVTEALELTLLQFLEIRSVRFAIDSVVIEEWDA